MIAPDLCATGPSPPLAIRALAAAGDAGIRSTAPTAIAAKVVRIPALLLIKVLPSTHPGYAATVPRSPGSLGGRELRKQRRQLAQGLTAPARAEFGEFPALLGKGVEQPAGGLGHVGVQQEGRDPQALGEAVQHRVEPLPRRLVLRQLPGLGLLDV